MLEVGKKSSADKVKYSILIQPPMYVDPTEGLRAYTPEYDAALKNYDSTEYDQKMKEYREGVDWLDNLYPCRLTALQTGRKILLVVGTESFVNEVWSMRVDNYKGTCYLEYLEKSDA